MLKPVPIPTVESAPYWQAAANGKLVLQRCGQCHVMQSIPRQYCGACQSDSLVWIDACGRGSIVSYSWVERGPTKAFASPYMLALVELEEGVRLMLNIIGPRAEQASIGDSVEIIFEARGDDRVRLPQAQLTDPPAHKTRSIKAPAKDSG